MTEYSRERSNRMQAILFAFAIVMANNTDVAFEDTLKKPLSFQEQEKTVKKVVSKATLNKNRWTVNILTCGGIVKIARRYQLVAPLKRHLDC